MKEAKTRQSKNKNKINNTKTNKWAKRIKKKLSNTGSN